MSPNPKSKSRNSSLSLSRGNQASGQLRRGEIKISDPIPIPREGDGYGPQALPQAADIWPRQSIPPAVHDYAQESGNRPLSDPRTSDPRTSSHRTTASLSTHPSKSSLGKQKGGFRATMKRIFGGKKKRDTITSIAEEPPTREALSFITVADSATNSVGKQRVSSMPIQDVTRLSALGSHAPALLDHTGSADEYRTLQRNSFDGTYQLRRRKTFGDEIGLATGEALTPSQKRRSRSAGHLREAAQRWRNRDEEIIYWRQSAIESPAPAIDYSSRPTTRDDTSSPQATRTEEEPASISNQPIEEAGNAPILHVVPSQTFDFGNLVNIAEDTVEQRLTTIEVKLMDLEMALARLSGHDHDGRKSVILDKPPPGRKPSLFSSESDDRSTGESSGSSDSPEPTFLTSPKQLPGLSQQDHVIPATDDRYKRSSNATTLRPNTAVRRADEEPTSPGLPTYATLEHIEKLMILVQREQANRHRLELQVRTLENQLEQMQRSPPYSHFKTKMYPTPSPEEASLLSARQASGGEALRADRRRLPPPRFRDDISLDTDTEDGYMDIYETPTENKELKFSTENLRDQPAQIAGMI